MEKSERSSNLRSAQRLMEILRRAGDVRDGRVAHLRRAIRTRTYENDLKLQVAIERLLPDTLR